MEKPDLYPGISDYLEDSEYDAVQIDHLEELVYILHASTNLTLEQCRIIIRTYFAGMRAALLRQKEVQIKRSLKLLLTDKKLSVHMLPEFKAKLNEFK